MFKLVVIRDDGGDTLGDVSVVESVGAACGQTYECRPWTPPSIWADMVRFSNLSSPEYIMDLLGTAHQSQKNVQMWALEQTRANLHLP